MRRSGSKIGIDSMVLMETNEVRTILAKLMLVLIYSLYSLEIPSCKKSSKEHLYIHPSIAYTRTACTPSFSLPRIAE